MILLATQGFLMVEVVVQLGGGTAIYIRNNINCELIKTYDTENGFWIKLSLPNNKNYNIAAYYRPTWTDIQAFNSNLENFLDKYGKLDGRKT